jgi:hypothetical protein
LTGPPVAFYAEWPPFMYRASKPASRSAMALGDGVQAPERPAVVVLVVTLDDLSEKPFRSQGRVKIGVSW